MNGSNSVANGTAVDGVLGLRMLPEAMLLGAVGAVVIQVYWLSWLRLKPCLGLAAGAV